ncbi:leucine-rich_repeat protein [Hexamita inflata]|uniref:Leucine-rich repeat protein n=1 Tax=Hexamita inflata TaxID=28002 RepID=A0AA86UZ48_9EUKA|nr:leucine-rich repeat protein [Hexamita inflata]
MHLDFNNTKIRTLEGINSLQNLQSLNVSSCLDFKYFDGIEGLHNLQHLDASYTAITSLHLLNTLPKLLYLNISGTHKLQSFEGIENSLSIVKIEAIKCYANSTSGLCNLPQLRVLKCNSSKLSSIDGLVNVPLLQELYLNNTQIISFDNLKNFTLSTLEVANCRWFQALSDDNITTLNIWGCRMDQLHSSSVKHLNMVDAHISDLSINTDCVVQLSAQQLQSFKQLDQFKHLHIVDCQYSLPNLSHILSLSVSGEFRSLNLSASLTNLDLSNSKTLNFNSLKFCANLVSLIAQFTLIKNFNGLENLFKLKTIDVQNNPELQDFTGMKNCSPLQIICSHSNLKSNLILVDHIQLKSLHIQDTGVDYVEGETDQIVDLGISAQLLEKMDLRRQFPNLTSLTVSNIQFNLQENKIPNDLISLTLDGEISNIVSLKQYFKKIKFLYFNNTSIKLKYVANKYILVKNAYIDEQYKVLPTKQYYIDPQMKVTYNKLAETNKILKNNIKNINITITKMKDVKFGLE